MMAGMSCRPSPRGRNSKVPGLLLLALVEADQSVGITLLLALGVEVLEVYQG